MVPNLVPNQLRNRLHAPNRVKGLGMSKRRNKRTPLTEDERKLLGSYRELSPEDRRDLVGWAEHLALNTVRLNGIRDAYRRCNAHRRELIAVYANEQMELSSMERRGEHVPFTSNED